MLLELLDSLGVTSCRHNAESRQNTGMAQLSLLLLQSTKVRLHLSGLELYSVAVWIPPYLVTLLQTTRKQVTQPLQPSMVEHIPDNERVVFAVDRNLDNDVVVAEDSNNVEVGDGNKGDAVVELMLLPNLQL